MLLVLSMSGRSAAQSVAPTANTETNTIPNFLRFLEAPQKELTAKPRDELVTDPDATPEVETRTSKKLPVIAKPNLKTKNVDRIEDLAPAQVMMEDTHEFVSDSLVTLSNRIDSFIGDKRADDELNRSSLRLAYSYRVRESTRGQDNKEVRFNLRLPTIDKRLRALSFRDAPTPAEKAAIKERKKREREPWRFRSDVGVSVSIPRPQAFTRARLRKNWILDKWIPRFQEEIGWYTDRSWVNNLQFNIDREIQKNEQLFRFSNEADWRITGKRFVTSHGPSLIHNTSDDDVWSYNLRIGTVKESENYTHYYMSSYGISIAYRRNLQGQWLYGEIVPALDWPKEFGWRRTPGITFKIETLFGRR